MGERTGAVGEVRDGEPGAWHRGAIGAHVAQERLGESSLRM